MSSRGKVVKVDDLGVYAILIYISLKVFYLSGKNILEIRVKYDYFDGSDPSDNSLAWENFMKSITSYSFLFSDSK